MEGTRLTADVVVGGITAAALGGQFAREAAIAGAIVAATSNLTAPHTDGRYWAVEFTDPNSALGDIQSLSLSVDSTNHSDNRAPIVFFDSPALATPHTWRENMQLFVTLFCGLAGSRTFEPAATYMNCMAAYYRGLRGQAPAPLHECALLGLAYDARSGNSYTCSFDGSELELSGFNAGTGSRWRTYYEQSGDMHGTDARGDFWKYVAATATYSNVGTGRRRCTGVGASRFCTR
jgi:hypothetical protein